MSALLWQPPQLSGIGHHDALWNAILTHSRNPIPLTGNVYAMFEPIEAPAEQALCTRVRVGTSTNACVLFVVWRHFPFQSMLQASLSVDDLPVLPSVLRDALIEGMTKLITQSALQDVLENGGPDIAILSNESLSAQQDRLPDDLAWFDVILENIAQEPIAMSIGCARSQLIAVAASHATPPRAIQETAKASITLPATYTLGAANFFPRQLAQLTEGAVIVLPSQPPTQRLVRVDKSVWEFHAQGGAWILAGQRKRIQESQRQRLKERHVTDQVQMDETKVVLADESNDKANTLAPSQSSDIFFDSEAHDFSAETDPAESAPNENFEPMALTSWTEENAGSQDATEIAISDNSESVDEPVKDGKPENPESTDVEPLPAIDWVEDALVHEGVRLSDLGITIDFDIGERDFTLAEIETWQPGAVVALDPPSLTDRVEVTLRANGRVIATGDLIAIDDRLAVRLSKMLLRA